MHEMMNIMRHSVKRKERQVQFWELLHEITLADGTVVHQCNHCGEKVKKCKDGTTTPMRRHLQECPKLKVVQKGQLKLNVMPGKLDGASGILNWKFDMTTMREVIAHMIMVHELPFSLLSMISLMC
ncbi:putative transcription factor/ chromatin remodeling BED-type(Zn) family [Helianthus anomalus]